jgi:hypothetical protein
MGEGDRRGEVGGRDQVVLALGHRRDALQQVADGRRSAEDREVGDGEGVDDVGREAAGLAVRVAEGDRVGADEVGRHERRHLLEPPEVRPGSPMWANSQSTMSRPPVALSMTLPAWNSPCTSVSGAGGGRLASSQPATQRMNGSRSAWVASMARHLAINEST